jgi:hypothetical protein
MYPEKGDRSIVFTDFYVPLWSTVPKRVGRGSVCSPVGRLVTPANSRFLDSAVAFAPAPLGMTKVVKREFRDALGRQPKAAVPTPPKGERAPERDYSPTTIPKGLRSTGFHGVETFFSIAFGRATA